MDISEQLLEVQAKLKVPKGQRNTFGNYNYRSCEDILEAAKPLLKEAGLTLTLDDKVEQAGTHTYIQATATLTNADKQTISNHGYAREAETKKGMDDSQITGTTSSYARKYALNGLFLIDDTKDADTDEYQRQQDRPKGEAGKQQGQPPKPPQDTAQPPMSKETRETNLKVIEMLIKSLKLSPEYMSKNLEANYKVATINDLSDIQISKVLIWLNGKKNASKV